MLAGLLLLAGSGSIAAACHDLDQDGQELTGLVFLRTYYGPPNYGEDPESDALETQMFLALDRPLCVNDQQTPGDPSLPAQDIVTVVPHRSMRADDLVGRRVTLKGSLFKAQTGHHRTEILIQVSEAPKILRQPESTVVPDRPEKGHRRPSDW